MTNAKGFAVLYNGNIEVSTISSTEIGAMVNWLVVHRKIAIRWGTDEKAIKECWDTLTDSITEVVVPVSIIVDKH